MKEPLEFKFEISPYPPDGWKGVLTRRVKIEHYRADGTADDEFELEWKYITSIGQWGTAVTKEDLVDSIIHYIEREYDGQEYNIEIK